MYSPESLEIVNFLSHSHTKITDFCNDKLTLIFGKNTDDKSEGADSNGSGKSGLIEAITIALTGEPYRDINKEDFIQDGKKEAKIIFILKNEALKERLKIERLFSRTSSAKINIYLNDSVEPLKQLTSVAEGNKWIYERIGINRELLLTFFIINQDNKESFFSSSDSKQKDIIKHFVNFITVDKVIADIELTKKDLITLQSTLNTEMSSVEHSLKEFNELLETEKTNEQSSIEEDIKSYKEQIEGYKEQQIINNDLIEILKNEIPLDEILLSEYASKIVDLKELKEERKLNKRQKDSISETIDVLQKEKKKIKLEIDSFLECPNCSHKFLFDGSGLTQNELQKLFEEKNSLVDFNNNLSIDVEKCLIGIEEEIKLFDEVQDKFDDLEYEIKQKNKTITSNKEENKSLEKQIAKAEKRIGEIKSEAKKVSNVVTYEKKIKELTNKRKELLPEIETVNKEIENNNFWLFHLGKKGFQTYLANKCIKTIEVNVNAQLKKIRSNLSVKINGYTILNNGEVRDKIDIFINKNGVQGKFAKFSGGQKERISLSGILTFHNLINRSLNGKGLNLLCLDESLDHLDALGQINCLEILKLSKVTTWIISHGKVETALDGYKKIIVEYKNSESKLI